VPLVLVVLATVVFLVTGLAAGWALWMFAAWWFFGHRHGGGMGPSRRRRQVHRGRSGRLDEASGRSQARAGFWV
jgi:hypothetical protein